MRMEPESKSLWDSFSQSTDFPRLQNDTSVDVVIIGGGITGISTAEQLQNSGLSTIVLEAGKIGHGTTSHSTGNLYVNIEEMMISLKEKYERSEIRQVVKARKKAFDLIVQNVKDYQIDCDLKNRFMFIYDTEKSASINSELEFDRQLHISAHPIDAEHFIYPFQSGIQYSDQAQFNPLLYVQALATVVHESDSCNVYENTRVQRIEKENDNYKIITPSAVVRAKFVVHATHTPKGKQLPYHSRLGAYREYGVAAILKESTIFPKGIFWLNHKGEKYSFRTYFRNGKRYVLAIGKPHKVGQKDDNRECVEELIAFLKQRFPIKEITHQWGAQNYKPTDNLPFIGRMSSDSNEFIATGFSTDGLIYGTLSATIIANIIKGIPDPFQELFEPHRFQLLQSAKKFFKENLNVTEQLVTDWVFKKGDLQLPEIPKGEGVVVKRDGKRLAVYRNSEGKSKILSAVCTHLGCIIHWNKLEKTWDCPCHGSRYNVEGDILEGPALDPLKKLK